VHGECADALAGGFVAAAGERWWDGKDDDDVCFGGHPAARGLRGELPPAREKVRRCYGCRRAPPVPFGVLLTGAAEIGWRKCLRGARLERLVFATEWGGLIAERRSAGFKAVFFIFLFCWCWTCVLVQWTISVMVEWLGGAT
jgi:hypothetical protein